MNTEQAKALGMLAKTLPGFSWEPRMMNGEFRYILHCTDIGDDGGLAVRWQDPDDGYLNGWCSIEDEDWPDFRDPPTMGWLLHQVREACDDYFEVWLDTSCGWKATCWRGSDVVTTIGAEEGGFTSEIETLIAVLQYAATPREPHTSKGSARCPQ